MPRNEPVVTDAWTEGQRAALVSMAILAAAGLIAVALAVLLPADVKVILLPAWAAAVLFLLFSALLRMQVGHNLFGEIGFLYLALALAYTLVPAFGFVFIGLRDDDLLASFLPARSDLGVHLWRHALFIFAVAAGYLGIRGRAAPGSIAHEDPDGLDGPTIVFLLGMAIVCVFFLTALSAPVETYYDHYTRYDHLPWLLRKFVSVCVRLKLGIYTVLITFLFLNFRKYWKWIPVVLAAISIHEITYSLGSRIESLIILMGAACLYNFAVKPVSLKIGLVTGLALAALFSGVELFRAMEPGQASLAELKPASEFGAVFFTSFHLYAERAQGSLPPREWPMLFNDFISLVTFGDFSRWNPQEWYYRNYFPDAPVAPQTLGPIADSAIWGGETDLLVRGILNGMFFAFLVRWFLRDQGKWWRLATYVYCFATCILTIKYSIFYHLVPLLKTLLPTLLLVGAFRSLLRASRRSEGATPA